MKKMTSLILNGVKAENEEVFMNRIGTLLERHNLLDLLVDGVPVIAAVTDEAAFINWVATQHPKWHNIELKNAPEIDNHDNVHMCVKYTETHYYRTEQGAKNDEWRERADAKDEDHQYEGERSDSTWINLDITTPGVKILLV